jgi:hypothetical protein
VHEQYHAFARDQIETRLYDLQTFDETLSQRILHYLNHLGEDLDVIKFISLL